MYFEELPERPRAFGRMATLLVAGLRDSGIGADKDDYGANRGERARIDDDLAEDGAAGGGGLRERRKAARAERGPHVPLADRVAQGALDLAARLFSAGAGGFVAWLALSNMRPLTLAFGSGASYVAGIAALAVAVLAGVWANVGALVAFCLLGMSIVAEGVETERQAEFLNSQGCSEMQGYYFHKPMPVEDLEAMATNCTD